MPDNKASDSPRAMQIVSLVLIYYIAHLSIPLWYKIQFIFSDVEWKAVIYQALCFFREKIFTAICLLLELLKKVGLFIAIFAQILKQSFCNWLLVYIVRFRIAIIVGSLLLVIAGNIGVQISRFDGVPLSEDVRRVNYWPALPASYYPLSKQAFDTGNIELSYQILAYSIPYDSVYAWLGLDRFYIHEKRETQDYLYQLDQLSTELEAIAKLESQAPYSTYLLTRKVEILAKLDMMESAGPTIDLIEWIDPMSNFSTLGIDQ